MPTSPAVLGVAQVAARLGVTPRTVRRHIIEGRIAATKTGPGTAGYVVAESEVTRLEAVRKP